MYFQNLKCKLLTLGMIKTRINPKTKKEEIWVQPDGLPNMDATRIL